MTDDGDTPRSRRAVLGAGAAAVLGAVAATFGRPTPVRAGSDGDVVLGRTNVTDGVTEIRSTRSALVAATTGPADYAVRVSNQAGGGLLATVQASDAVVIQAEHQAPTGLGVGVSGSSWADRGVGVAGSGYVGVWATTHEGAGLLAQTGGGGAAVYAEADRIDSFQTLSVEPHTAVFGQSIVDADGKGVVGRAAKGYGVRGEAASGIGGYFVSGGVALQVAGKAKFSRSGVASVPAGKQSVDVAVPGGLDSASAVFATIQTYRPGVYVAGVRRNYPSPGKARIYLSKVASTAASTPVAWFVAS